MFNSYGLTILNPIEGDMKRGNMKEKWGLHLLYSVDNGRLELMVQKGKDMD